MKAVIMDMAASAKSPGALTPLYNGECVFERQLRLLQSAGIAEIAVATPRRSALEKLAAQENYGGLSLRWLSSPSYVPETGLFRFNEAFWQEETDLSEGILYLPAQLICSPGFLKRFIRGKQAALAVKKSIEEEPAFPLMLAEQRVSAFFAPENEEERYASLRLYKLFEPAESLAGAAAVEPEEGELCIEAGAQEAERLRDIDDFEQEVFSGAYALIRVTELLQRENAHHPFLISDEPQGAGLLEALLRYEGITAENFPVPEEGVSLEQAQMTADCVKRQRADILLSFGGDNAADLAKCVKLLLNRQPTGRHFRHIAVSGFRGNGREALASALLSDGGKLNEAGMLPDFVILEPRLLAELPGEKKKRLALQALCQCGEFFCTARMSEELLETADQAGRWITGAIAGFLQEEIASCTAMARGLHLARKLLERTSVTPGYALGVRIARQLNLPEEVGAAWLAPRFWAAYSEKLPASQAARGKKSVAAHLGHIDAVFGFLTNEERVEFFRFLFFRLGIAPPRGIADKQLRPLLRELPQQLWENAPVLLTQEECLLLCQKASAEEPPFSYPPAEGYRKGPWENYLQFWRIQLSSAELERRRKAQQEVLDAVVRLCEKQGLRYFLSYGTLLGAVRHQGSIPWNDNIDLSMPREDYERLLKNSGSWLPEGLFAHSAGQDPACWFTHLRILRQDIRVESKQESAFFSDYKGIGVCIWPMDRVKRPDGILQKLRHRLLRGTEAVIQCRLNPGARKMGWKGKLAVRLSGILKLSSLHRLYHRIAAGSGRGAFWSLGSRYPFGAEILPESCFSSDTLLDYAGKKYRVPQGWDRILSSLYGDYSQLPPPEKCRAPRPVRVAYGGKAHALYPAPLPSGIPSAKKSKPASLLQKLRGRLRRLLSPIKRLCGRAFVRISGALRSHGLILSENSRLLASYRNKYAGQRCFLIGNGPSLKAEDLDRMQGEITFGCNLICKIYDQTRWRPTFYCVSDSSIIKTCCREVVEKLGSSILMIREFACRFMSIRPRNMVQLPYISVDWYKVHGNMLEYHYISHATVMSMMIELAMYMGFQEIYLIGVDGTSASAKGSHFVDNYFTKEMKQYADNIKKRTIKNYDPKVRAAYLQQRTLEIFTQLREYADRHGLKIYNATRGGYVEIFERADLDSLLAPAAQEAERLS